MFLFFFGGFDGEKAEFFFILVVEIAIVLRNCNVDFAAELDVNFVQLGGFVVAFSTPCYVVGVAEGIDVENVNIRWRE